MVIWIAPVEGKQNWLCNMSQGDYLINYSNWKGKGIGGYILMAFKCCYNYNKYKLWIMYKGLLQTLSVVYNAILDFCCIHVSFKNQWCVNLIIFHIEVHTKVFGAFNSKEMLIEGIAVKIVSYAIKFYFLFYFSNPKYIDIFQDIVQPLLLYFKQNYKSIPNTCFSHVAFRFR